MSEELEDGGISGVGRFRSREERRLGAVAVGLEEGRRRLDVAAARPDGAAAVSDGGSDSGGGSPLQRACSLVMGIVGSDGGREFGGVDGGFGLLW